MDIRNIPTVFILGRPRSGTTLLHLILNGHPNVLIPTEAPVFLEMRYRYKKVEYWSPKLLKRFHQDLLKVSYFEDMPIDHEGLKKDIMSMVGKHSYFELFGLITKNYQDYVPRGEIKLVGDKNPVYSIFSDYIFEEFPEARFIHIYRDYRDNIESLLRMNFEAGITALLAYRWKFTYRLMDKLMKKNPERIYRLKYEDLCENPEQYTREICDFLGIDYRDEMLDFHKAYTETENKLKKETAKIHKNLKKPINKERIGLWKKRLSKKQVKIADMVVGSLAEEAGYERKYKKHNIWLRISQAPILLYGRLVFFAMRHVEFLPSIMREFMAFAIAQLIKIYNFLSGKSKKENISV